MLVAPLDDALDVYEGYPAALPVAAARAGTRGAQVALVPQLRAVPIDRFEAARVGRVDRATLRRAEELVRLVFDLD